ncbi:Nitroreductase [Paenibacillus sp. UNCCL117]|uniref:nitroreductase family protein n=1 Tax=unclassified Paenibacillus TaxID=185978 RepID=UPI0008841D5B|nr:MULTISPECIES: nitroreductase family protein [unclassified Paenibacillus]SDC27762.1 Nitroreductase [Paenibacillus sp. cl123]SFW20408.1 Nitroreductase [Paenibacillus sp. UNCCL117]
MNIPHTIRERRTIRRFNSTPVTPELVVSLLTDAANLYEDEGTPRWRCLFAGTPESRHRLVKSMTAKMKESRFVKLMPAKMIDFFIKQITDMPAHLIFIAESASDRRRSDENYAAVCSVMQNFQLLGWERGLGALWDTDPMLQSESFHAEIGLQKGERFAGILHIGYFDKAPRARRRTPAEQKWTAIGEDAAADSLQPDYVRIPAQSILKVLNDAVWAPNDGLREPWRFIYVTGSQAAAKLSESDRNAKPALLLVVAKQEADPHKREEDYAAVCCLIQNVQLLLKSGEWHARRSIPDWIYDEDQCKPFGIQPGERIVAVLELGENGRPPQSEPPSLPRLIITHL